MLESAPGFPPATDSAGLRPPGAGHTPPSARGASRGGGQSSLEQGCPLGAGTTERASHRHGSIKLLGGTRVIQSLKTTCCQKDIPGPVTDMWCHFSHTWSGAWAALSMLVI